MRILYKISFILILLTAYVHPGFCQGNFSIGAYLGGGNISGTSSPQASFTSSIFLETGSFLIETINLRFNFFYSEDYNILLPGSRNNYYPFMKAFSVRGVSSQPYGKNYFAEETIGFIIIDDRTFAGVHEWNYGTVFSLGTGFDFRALDMKGFKVGVSLEYAITFGNTFAKYFSLHLQSQYFF